MPLHAPILDDRSYAQLRDELIARIPVYAPEWTDHHPSDPGITLLELFAFLGESLLFRFNQIPDATRLAFLQLLQAPLRPAVPAKGLVRFTTATGVERADVDLDTVVRAGDVGYRVTTETTCWPLEARAAVRAAVTEVLDVDTEEFVQRARDAVGADTVQRYRTTFGAAEPTRPGGDLLVPGQSIDGSVYVALVRPKPTTPVPAELAGSLLSIGVVPAEDVLSMADVDPCPGPGAGSPSPPMQWQVCSTLPTSGADPDIADPIWWDLDVVADTTAGMTRPGIVRLRMPADLADVGLYLPADPDAHGAGDSPPLLEDADVAARLLAWLRVFRPGGGGGIPTLAWLAANAASVEQAVPAAAELLGGGTGEPGQVLRLVNAGIIGAAAVEVEELGTGRWEPWAQVEDLRSAGPEDRVFMLDREAGAVAFGDGRRGRPPQIGERIRSRGYRWGGGAAGNVGPGVVAKVDLPDVKVTNDVPIRGGADAEPMAEAMQRIPEEFRRHDRAVTVSDFAEQARATSGADIVRADTLRLFHPDTPEEEVPGAISVVIWPREDRANPRAPRPDRTTLRAVCAHLDQRRLVTTEVHVIPPTYRQVAIAVGIAVKPDHGIEAVRRWVGQVLRQYLSPVPPHGPEGGGWPLGRPVFGPELEAAALQVEGLSYLRGLRLSVRAPDGSWTEQTAPATIGLKAWEVPDLAELTVVDGEPLVPGVAVTPAPPSGPAVPVREPTTVC